MDYAEFEQYVADYMEGILPEELRRRMDQARRQNPELDELARLHEQILTALTETPQATIPENLSRRIRAAAEERDKVLAQENNLFRRTLLLWSALVAAGTVMVSALYYIFQDTLAADFSEVSIMESPIKKLLDNQSELALNAAVIMLKWLSAAGNLLITPVPVPGTEFALPGTYLFAAAALAIALWYHSHPKYA